MNELSNYDIIDILQNYNIEINGIFNKDKLPYKLQQGFYICNMQNSTDGNGTHWVAFYYDFPKKSYYFDSFGFDSPNEIHDKIKPYLYNQRDIQDINSSSCGYYCIAFIKMLYNKRDKERFYNLFTNYFSDEIRRNEMILKILLDSY